MRFLLCVPLYLSLCGCSALWWGGETTRQPGLTVRQGPGGFELHATADTHARVARLRMGSAEVEDAEFGQSASSVVEVEPAKLDAVARLQLTQAEYARITWAGVAGLLAQVRDIAAELTPVLRLLAAAELADTERGVTMTLPGGLTLGGREVRSSRDLREWLGDAERRLAEVAPTAQPSGEPR